MGRGGRAVLAGLGVAWAAYSRVCVRIETRLAQQAGRANVHGRRLTTLTAAALARLGRAGLRGLGSAVALVRTTASTARTRVQAIGKSASSASAATVDAATTAADRLRAIKRAKSNGGAPRQQAQAASPPPADSRDAKSREDGVRPTVAATAAGAPFERGWAWLLSAWSPPKVAFAGLAAASVGVLFLAFSLSPADAPAGQVLTLSIPARPAAQQAPVEPSAGSPRAEAAASEGDAASPKLDDPLTEMAAYVGALPKANAVPARPVLTGIETIDGLDQFARAAELVGLEQLLQPGESYTIFAPNDAAFAELAPGEIDGLLDPSGHERLLTLLSHHVLPERLTFDDLAGDIRAHRTLAGQTMTIDATDVVRIGDAGMVEADIQAEQGVLHVIDQVLPVAQP